VTSRDRVGWVKHLARILRSSHPIGLGNLPDPRIRVGRVNSIGLKPDPTIILNFLFEAFIEFLLLFYQLYRFNKYSNFDLLIFKFEKNF